MTTAIQRRLCKSKIDHFFFIDTQKTYFISIFGLDLLLSYI